MTNYARDTTFLDAPPPAAMVLSAAPNENPSWVSLRVPLWVHGGADAWYVCLRRRQPSSAASTPTSPTAPAPASSKWSVAGQVVATGSQQGVGGATLTPGWSLKAVTADAEGNYELGDRAIPPAAPSPGYDFATRLHVARRVDHVAAGRANECDARPGSRCAAVFDGVLPAVRQGYGTT